jgi:hypothetical protein
MHATGDVKRVQQNRRTPVGIDAEFISMYRVEA